MLAIQNKILEFGKDYCKDKSIKEVRLVWVTVVQN